MQDFIHAMKTPEGNVLYRVWNNNGGGYRTKEMTEDELKTWALQAALCEVVEEHNRTIDERIKKARTHGTSCAEYDRHNIEGPWEKELELEDLVFAEEDDCFIISGRDNVVCCIYKNTGDMLVGWPFPVRGCIEKKAVICLHQQDDQKIFCLLWKRPGGHMQQICLGLFEGDCQNWLIKINALFK